MEITKDSVIGDVLDNHPELAEHFLAMGMHCLGCPVSRGEKIEQACAAHGVNCEELLAKLNNAVK